MNKTENKLPKHKLAIFWTIFCVLGRLLPHLPNVTPMTNLSLFAGSKLPRYLAYLIIFSSLLISDLALAYFQGYPLFSSWTFFTYSGFAAIILFGSKLLKSTKLGIPLFTYVLASSLGFWLWTNFGVWLSGGLYAKNLSGLTSCYLAGLPFLRNALLGDFGWCVIIFGIFNLAEKPFLRRKLKISQSLN